MTVRHDNFLEFSIALSSGLGLSHHIINRVILNCKSLNIDFKLARDYLKDNFPSLPELTNKHWDVASEIITVHDKNNIKSISILSPLYPKSLMAVRNPPSVLYLRGDVNIFNSLPGVAVVGTRKVTSNGSIIAKRISNFLASQGWTIISGLAIGVDTSAHNGALEGHGKTIAVLAHGLHKASPKQNSLLADEILLHGGAWVSEHPWGVEPRREYFVPRNRIQIGLSAGSIIVESEIKSGTSTQAEFCVEARRPLFAVVPQSDDNHLSLLSEGPLNLVKNMGAYPIKTRHDYPQVIFTLDKSRSSIQSL